MESNKVYGVRRFCQYRDDRHCFEVYVIATGECASLPGTKRDSERYAKQLNAEEAAKLDQDAQDVMDEQQSNYNADIGASLSRY